MEIIYSKNISQLEPIPNSTKFRHKLTLGDVTLFDGKIDVVAAIRGYRLPDNFFVGKRVLDIGAWSGGFSFYFELLGAEVLAVDVMSPADSGFNRIQNHFGFEAHFERKAIYDLDPSEDGLFDVVFYQGVFYHLKHPLLAMERINAVLKTGGTLVGGGTSSDIYFNNAGRSINISKESLYANSFPLAFFVRDDFLGDRSNWWIPNEACCEAWLKRSGFTVKEIWTREGGRSLSGEPRTVTRFVATKIADPEPEHPFMSQIEG